MNILWFIFLIFDLCLCEGQLRSHHDELKILPPLNEARVIVSEQDGPYRDGSYYYHFVTDNGITREEQGKPKTPQILEVKGKFAYHDTEGDEFKAEYIADEKGFRIVPDGTVEFDRANLKESNKIQTPIFSREVEASQGPVRSNKKAATSLQRIQQQPTVFSTFTPSLHISKSDHPKTSSVTAIRSQPVSLISPNTTRFDIKTSNSFQTLKEPVKKTEAQRPDSGTIRGTTKQPTPLKKHASIRPTKPPTEILMKLTGKEPLNHRGFHSGTAADVNVKQTGTKFFGSTIKQPGSFFSQTHKKHSTGPIGSVQRQPIATIKTSENPFQQTFGALFFRNKISVDPKKPLKKQHSSSPQSTHKPLKFIKKNPNTKFNTPQSTSQISLNKPERLSNFLPATRKTESVNVEYEQGNQAVTSIQKPFDVPKVTSIQGHGAGSFAQSQKRTHDESFSRVSQKHIETSIRTSTPKTDGTLKIRATTKTSNLLLSATQRTPEIADNKSPGPSSLKTVKMPSGTSPKLFTPRPTDTVSVKSTKKSPGTFNLQPTTKPTATSLIRSTHNPQRAHSETTIPGQARTSATKSDHLFQRTTSTVKPFISKSTRIPQGALPITPKQSINRLSATTQVHLSQRATTTIKPSVTSLISSVHGSHGPFSVTTKQGLTRISTSKLGLTIASTTYKPTHFSSKKSSAIKPTVTSIIKPTRIPQAPLSITTKHGLTREAATKPGQPSKRTFATIKPTAISLISSTDRSNKVSSATRKQILTRASTTNHGLTRTSTTKHGLTRTSTTKQGLTRTSTTKPIASSQRTSSKNRPEVTSVNKLTYRTQGTLSVTTKKGLTVTATKPAHSSQRATSLIKPTVTPLISSTNRSHKVFSATTKQALTRSSTTKHGLIKTSTTKQGLTRSSTTKPTSLSLRATSTIRPAVTSIIKSTIKPQEMYSKTTQKQGATSTIKSTVTPLIVTTRIPHETLPVTTKQGLTRTSDKKPTHFSQKTSSTIKPTVTSITKSTRRPQGALSITTKPDLIKISATKRAQLSQRTTSTSKPTITSLIRSTQKPNKKFSVTINPELARTSPPRTGLLSQRATSTIRPTVTSITKSTQRPHGVLSITSKEGLTKVFAAIPTPPTQRSTSSIKPTVLPIIRSTHRSHGAFSTKPKQDPTSTSITKIVQPSQKPTTIRSTKRKQDVASVSLSKKTSETSFTSSTKKPFFGETSQRPLGFSPNVEAFQKPLRSSLTVTPIVKKKIIHAPNQVTVHDSNAPIKPMKISEDFASTTSSFISASSMPLFTFRPPMHQNKENVSSPSGLYGTPGYYY